MNKVVIYNIGMLVTPLGSSAKAGALQSDVRQLKNAYVVAQDGVFTHSGTGDPPGKLLHGAQVFDACGRLATPGLVDAHTHLVFGGWRAHELQQKLVGVPYLDILQSGGGILDTVRATRAASQQELVEKTQTALQGMLSQGTTTAEAKSGYGLDLENELKQLLTVQQLQKLQPISLVSTLMAAHALPEEYKQDRQGYMKLMIDEIIPVVAKEGLAEFCDVFCESGVFTVAESKAILQAAHAHGLRAKIHADEIDAIGGSELAGDLGAISAEHLIAMRDSGIRSLKEGGTIACLLPATSFYLDKPYARARDLIAAGVPVAVASDFNPGSCPSYSLQVCINLASWKYKMTPEEILIAVTLNAAAAIGRADRTGSIETGKQADLLLWDADSLEFLCYRFGSNLVHTVFKNGIQVVRN
ncbi:MAG: imidazolonepropionase [Christensenellales bacterium]|jgi:imidazolonepropionase